MMRNPIESYRNPNQILHAQVNIDLVLYHIFYDFSDHWQYIGNWEYMKWMSSSCPHTIQQSYIFLCMTTTPMFALVINEDKDIKCFNSLSPYYGTLHSSATALLDLLFAHYTDIEWQTFDIKNVWCKIAPSEHIVPWLAQLTVVNSISLNSFCWCCFCCIHICWGNRGWRC